jgi:hypothetical protein
MRQLPVVTSGLTASSGESPSGTLTFFGGGTSTSVDIIVNLAALQVSPNLVIVGIDPPATGFNIQIGAVDTFGNPIPGVAITGACTTDLLRSIPRPLLELRWQWSDHPLRKATGFTIPAPAVARAHARWLERNRALHQLGWLWLQPLPLIATFVDPEQGPRMRPLFFFANPRH